MAPATCAYSPKAVCVMDASGQLGKSLVNGLLKRGYVVHAAVQGHGNELQLVEEFSNDHGSKNLKIFDADPLDYHSVIDALKGCSGLLYTFEPPQEQPFYDEYMAEIEVRAAHNVLEACAQTETIEKVVFTSSVTAVIWNNDRDGTSCDLDEKHWSDPNFCRKYKLWHALSKTLSEKTAWALAMDRGVNMVSINAGLLMTPDLNIRNPYLKGAAEMYEDGVFVTVDIKFLVDALICVYEEISSYGRYLCFNQTINKHEDAVELAQILTPTLPPPPTSNDMVIIQPRISNKKLNKLMVSFDNHCHLTLC